MKFLNKLLLIFAFSLLITSNLFATEEKSEKPDFADYLISTGEIFYTNLSVVTISSALSEDSWSHFKLENLKNNFNSSFIWDNSSFVRNQLAHPYFGSLYFTAARSNDFGFLPSLLFTGLGSAMWETLFEVGDISTNDLITTTFAGAITGEVLYRLGNCAYGLFKPLAWAVNPMGSFSTWIRGNSFRTDSNISSAEVYLGSGFSNKAIVFPENEFNNSKIFILPDFYAGFNIVYNNPYGHSSAELFDQFDLCTDILLNNKTKLLDLKINGLLYGKDFSQNNTFTTCGLTLNYGILFSNMMMNSINSTGITIKQEFCLKNNYNVYYSGEVGYIFLGTADNYYIKNKDSTYTFLPSVTDYSYFHGPTANLYFKLEKINNWNIEAEDNLSYYINYSNSNSDSQKDGNILVNKMKVSMDYRIYKGFYLGIAEILYSQNYFYKKIKPVNQLLDYTELFVKYKF